MSVKRKRQASTLRTLYIVKNPLPYFRDWLDAKYPPRLYHPHYAKFFANAKAEYIQLVLQREIKSINITQKKDAVRNGHEYNPYVQEIIYAVSRSAPSSRTYDTEKEIFRNSLPKPMLYSGPRFWQGASLNDIIQ